MSYTDFVPKKSKREFKETDDKPLRPYTNFHGSHFKKLYKSIRDRTDKIKNELATERMIIFENVQQYIRDQLLDLSEYTDPFFEAAIEGIEPLDITQIVTVPEINYRLEQIFPSVDDSIREHLAPEEKVYLSKTDPNMTEFKKFIQDTNIPIKNGLMFVALMKTRIPEVTDGLDLKTLKDLFIRSTATGGQIYAPAMQSLLNKRVFTSDDKKKMKDLVIVYHNDAYEMFFGTVNNAVMKKWETVSEGFKRDIGKYWIDDNPLAMKFVEAYYNQMIKHAKQLANVEVKNAKSKHIKSRGRPKTSIENQTKTHLIDMMNGLGQDEQYKIVLGDRLKEYIKKL